MPLSDADVIRDQYEAVNERDFGRAMSHYADDVELVVPRTTFLASGTFQGRDAVGGWFGDWFATFDRDIHFDIQEITELDDGSFVLVADVEARGRVSGASARSTVVWVYRLRDGKIVHAENYPSREEAAAGR
jgi:ketosteroid isomerase-like protein